MRLRGAEKPGIEKQHTLQQFEGQLQTVVRPGIRFISYLCSSHTITEIRVSIAGYFYGLV